MRQAKIILQVKYRRGTQVLHQVRPEVAFVRRRKHLALGAMARTARRMRFRRVTESFD
jgi:hypothetical protein